MSIQRQVFIFIHPVQLKSGIIYIQLITSETVIRLVMNGKGPMVLLKSLMNIRLYRNIPNSGYYRVKKFSHTLINQ